MALWGQHSHALSWTSAAGFAPSFGRDGSRFPSGSGPLAEEGAMDCVFRRAPAHRWRQDAMDRVSRRAPAHRRRRRARWIACSVALRPIGGGGCDGSRVSSGSGPLAEEGAMDCVFHRAPAHWRRRARFIAPLSIAIHRAPVSARLVALGRMGTGDRQGPDDTLAAGHKNRARFIAPLRYPRRLASPNPSGRPSPAAHPARSYGRDSSRPPSSVARLLPLPLGSPPSAPAPASGRHGDRGRPPYSSFSRSKFNRWLHSRLNSGLIAL
jgi:hypothetical protein